MVISKKTNQQGFTLVELVVVIIILGILAAVALPKFMDVTTQAHESAVDGAAGGLGAGVALFHAQWVANGHTAATVDVAGFGDDDVSSNADGWPVSTDNSTNAPSSGDCVAIWNGLMQSPPSVATGTGSDYRAVSTGGECQYTYQLDASATRRIDYNYSTGNVEAINP